MIGVEGGVFEDKGVAIAIGAEWPGEVVGVSEVLESKIEDLVIEDEGIAGVVEGAGKFSGDGEAISVAGFEGGEVFDEEDTGAGGEGGEGAGGEVEVDSSAEGEQGEVCVGGADVGEFEEFEVV